MTRRVSSLLISLSLLLGLTSRASAGGLFLSDRGTRPIGRGNAFVAGADDPNALWYNPAGLGWSGRQLLLDATSSFYSVDFTRLDSGGNFQPPVQNNLYPIPVPGLAYSDSFGLRDFTFGFGLLAPNAALMDFPETISYGGGSYPAPQRYSLISMKGSLLSHLVGGVAWRPPSTPGLSLGVTGGMVLATLVARTTLSACDSVLCSQAENPDFDSLAEVTLRNAVAPHLSLGVTYERSFVRLGLSATMGYSLQGVADIAVRPPSAAVFDGAYVDGTQARMRLDFPWQVRAGVEFRPIEGLRTEIAFAWEGWSTQTNMSIEPTNVWLRNVTAIGDYQVGPVIIPRNMRDTYSVRLGSEYQRERWAVRGGIQYETGAFDNAHLTVLTPDSDKVILSIGGAFEVSKGVFVDASIAHAVIFDRVVRDSAVPQPNPIRPPPADPVYVGNGNYRMEATVAGLGLRWHFADAATEVAEPDSETAGADDERRHREIERRHTEGRVSSRDDGENQ